VITFLYQWRSQVGAKVATTPRKIFFLKKILALL